MICTNCGQEIADDAVKCDYCGTSVKPEISIDSRKIDQPVDQFYVRSGKVDLKLFYLGMPIMIASTTLLSFIYAYINVYNPLSGYVNFFLMIGFILGLVLILTGSLWFSNIRNLPVATAFGVLTGCTAVYMDFVAFEYVLVNSKYFKGEIDLLPLVFNPSDVWEMACAIAEKGWYTIHLYYSGEDFMPRGIILWICWTIEALCVFGLAVKEGAFSMIRQEVFCEKCKEWTNNLENILTFKFANEDELKDRLKKQDSSVLNDVKRVEKRDPISYRCDLHLCETCKKMFTLTLTKISKTRDKKDNKKTKEKTIFRNLIINQNVFEDIKRTGERISPPDKEEEPEE